MRLIFLNVQILIERIRWQGCNTTIGGGGGGVATQKTRKKTRKTSPKFRFFFQFLDKKFQPFKNHVNDEVLRGQELPNNTSYAYRALQKSYKSYYDQQEPLNQNPLNQSISAKMEKPKKKRKKKTIPNLKFAVVFGFLGCSPPQY